MDRGLAMTIAAVREGGGGMSARKCFTQDQGMVVYFAIEMGFWSDYKDFLCV
jgi:hypothetical protein